MSRRTVALVVGMMVAAALVAGADRVAGAPAAGKAAGGAVAVPVPAAVGLAPAAASPEDAQKVAEFQAQLMAGKPEDAVKGAQAFLKTARDDGAKTDAMRVAAEGLRKMKDWRGASGAYTVLRDRFEKDSDDYIRNDAIAEVLKASPQGVYMVGVATTGPTATKPGTLEDDTALEEALGRLACARASRLKSKSLLVRRCRSPQEVVKVFGAAAEEARMVFLLGPTTPPDDARELGTAAGKRLQDIAAGIQTTLRAKLEKFQKAQKFENPWSFTNVEKKEVQDTHKLCKDMAGAEKAFQESLFYVSGSGEWEAGSALRSESSERAAAYEQLAEEFIVPAYTTSVW